MKRRDFIQKASLALSVPLVGYSLLSCKSGSSTAETTSETAAEGISEFGLQLWTVKEDMAADAKGTLKKVADAGYAYIESFGGDKGIFWGMEPAEFKGYLDELGLKIVASHIDSSYTTDESKEEEFKQLVADASSIGIKYLINPFPGEYSTRAEFDAVAAGLNRQGKIAKEKGIKMGYHNHHLEFMPLDDGSLAENVLIENTDPELVDIELDLYWVVKAGQNPNEWLEKHGSRIKLCHVKDMLKEEKLAKIEKNEGPAEGFWPLGGSCVLGTGQIDFSEILSVAKANGMEYYIVEQERFDNSTPLEDIVKNAEYMKSFTFAS